MSVMMVCRTAIFVFIKRKQLWFSSAFADPSLCLRYALAINPTKHIPSERLHRRKMGLTWESHRNYIGRTLVDPSLWQGGKLSEAPFQKRTGSRASLSLPPKHNEGFPLQMHSKINLTPIYLQFGIDGELDFYWTWIGTGLELLQRKDGTFLTFV